MLKENNGLPGWSQMSRQSDKNFGSQGQAPISTTLLLEAWPLNQPQSEGQIQDSATPVSKQNCPPKSKTKSSGTT